MSFEKLVVGLDYPVFVVTAASGEEIAGCLVGFTTQCSIDPPRFLVFISKANRTYEVALTADSLAVHVLARTETALAERFGGETGDETDKFRGVSWRPGPGGAPVIGDGVRGWFTGRVIERFDAGDHCGFLLDPLAAETATGAGGDELGFQDTKGIEPGHPP